MGCHVRGAGTRESRVEALQATWCEARIDGASAPPAPSGDQVLRLSGISPQGVWEDDRETP